MTPPYASPRTSLDCPELAGVHVLVVDDDDDGREMLAALLTHNGAVVTQAGNAAEALAAFENDPPQILLSDIGLPVEDGFSLLQKIRALEAKRGGKVRALALSGYGSEEDRARSRSGGFEAHFTKPVSLHELLAAVQALLR